MTPLLAEVSSAEKWMLGCTIIMALASIGALVVAVVSINRKQEIRVEQPLEVRFAKEFVHQTMFNEHERDNLHAFSEMRKQREEDMIRGDMSRARIYDKLEQMGRDFNGIRKDMGEMGGKIIAEVLNARKL